MASRRFTIELDNAAADATVRDIEANSFFQSLLRIRELDLDDDEQGLVFEVAQRKEARISTLHTLANGRRPLAQMLSRLVERGYLYYRASDEQDPVVYLGAVLNPPRPITSVEAIEIQRQMNEAGQQGVLEVYIRKLVDTLGEEGLRVTAQIMRDKGRQIAERLPETARQGPKIAALRFIELMRANGTTIEVVDLEGDEVRFRVANCAYHLKRGEQALCDAVSAFDAALLEAWGCEIQYPVTIPGGAEYCEGVIRAATLSRGEEA